MYGGSIIYVLPRTRVCYTRTRRSPPPHAAQARTAHSRTIRPPELRARPAGRVYGWTGARAAAHGSPGANRLARPRPRPRALPL
jgi:hypothetical protein